MALPLGRQSTCGRLPVRPGPARPGWAGSSAIVVAALLLVVCGRLAGEEGVERTLPGAAPFDDGLRADLAAVRESKGPDYRPRTRHLGAEGVALYTNRLFLETSPYLLQHAHNPVSWYPWGDEAFEAARRLGRPVLLSVGYSTCHWCHVMEEESFEDRENGGYFLVGQGHEPLLARQKPATDGAEPSGNSVQALNLLRLYELTTDDGYRRRAEKTLAAFAPTLAGHAAALPEMLLAVDFHRDVAREIVIVTPSRAEAEPLLQELRSTFLPNRVLAVVEMADVAESAELVPLVRGKLAQGGKATAYVCETQVCKRPTTDPEVFAQQIRASPAVPGGG